MQNTAPNGEYYLPPAAPSFHCIDSDEDCSVISEISIDSMNDTTSVGEGTEMMHMDAIIPLEIHDSISTEELCTLQNNFALGSPTVVSSARSTPFADCSSLNDDEEDTMSTASSLIDIISLHRLSFMANLDSNVDPESCPLVNRINAFSLLPEEMVFAVTSFLDVMSLSQTRLVSKRLLELASRDEAGWKRHCEELWSRKAHVSMDAQSLFKQGSARRAFHVAGRDAVSRHHVSLEHELCFDPVTGNGTVWSFRFKGAAGMDWTSWDPWWSGGNARQMVFLSDGRVMQYVQGTAGAAHAGARDFCLMPPFHESGGDSSRVLGVNANSVGLGVRWRLVSQPMDLPHRPDGAYIRLTIAGRDVPTYVVHRSPTGNWGFVMESCWGVYASFPLPRRRNVNEPPVGQRVARPARMRLRRTTNGMARWFNVADMESDDEGEDDSVSAMDVRDCLEDKALSVNIDWQWREAVLYNYGATTLPEGEGATAEFDRVWNQAPLRPEIHDFVGPVRPRPDGS